MDPAVLKRIRLLFTVLNLVVGWHLLYEGLAKVLDSSWTSAGYLVNATGPLAGLFQRIADSPVLLQTTDILNMVGLTAIGLCIMTGVLTRFAAVTGAILIGLSRAKVSRPESQGTSWPRSRAPRSTMLALTSI